MLSTGTVLTAAGCSAIILLLVAGGSHGGTISTVHYGEPKKNMCSPHEVLKACEPCCEPTCDDDCLHAICRRTPDAVPVPTCVCRQGYVRHSGACIRKETCPSPYKVASYDMYRRKQHYPTPRTNSLKSCGLNEKLTHCRPSCEPTCEKNCTGVKHPEVCIPETSCICKDGFVRHKGRCIQRCDCPRRNPYLTRQMSGEYIDFDYVSMEALKSDEDFTYKTQAEFTVKRPQFPTYENKKSAMAPMYIRTMASVANSASASVEQTTTSHTTERPALYPPLCACHGAKKTMPPAFLPRLDDNPSYESTEEDSDIVPYAPPPSIGSYSRKTPSLSLFPPSTTGSVGPFFVPRKTLPAPPPVHRCDLNEPLDHFCGSGQQNSDAQDEPRKAPTIWPPVNTYTNRCACRRP
uniref:EGF-like domain-containing protein n=1 Tax=Anopheles minimus TaxID=112268 RepID=A0A182WBW7_9DIPT